jgi:hypothetical protein
VVAKRFGPLGVDCVDKRFGEGKRANSFKKGVGRATSIQKAQHLDSILAGRRALPIKSTKSSICRRLTPN